MASSSRWQATEASPRLVLALGFRLKLSSGFSLGIKPGLGFSLAVKLGSGHLSRRLIGRTLAHVTNVRTHSDAGLLTADQLAMPAASTSSSSGKPKASATIPNPALDLALLSAARAWFPRHSRPCVLASFLWRGARRDEPIGVNRLAHGLQAKTLPRQKFFVFSEGSLLAIVEDEHRQVGLDQGHAAVNLVGEDIFNDQDAASRLQRLAALAEYQGGSLIVPIMQYGLEHKKVAPWHGGVVQDSRRC